MVKNERGIALATTLVIMTVVSGLIAGIIFVGTQEQRVADNTRNAEQAFGAAETGVYEVLRAWSPTKMSSHGLVGTDSILIAPSNPITSIGPILAVPGIREALRETAARVVAVSPIIGNAAVSGPAARLMASQNLPASIAGIADSYADFLDTLIVHDSDAETAQALSSIGVEFASTDILMRTTEDRLRIANSALVCALPDNAAVKVAS